MTTITERVAAGAAYLDEHDPDWWKADVERAIDLDALDLGSGDTCILGQRCPLEVAARADVGMTPYFAWVKVLSAVQGDDYALDMWASGMGFQMTPGWVEDPDWDGDEFDALTAEWRKVITGRRAAA